MATQAPPSFPTNHQAAEAQPLIPPENTVWERYSPHHEAPLSFTGSGALHIVVIALLVLCGFLISLWITPPPKPLPVDTIRMPGGGGGNPKGKGNGPGIGSGGVDDGVDDPNNTTPIDPTLQQRPELQPDEVKKAAVDFANDPSVVRYIEDGNENMKKLARLDSDVRDRLRDGINPGKGQGGTGSGGGKGTGEGEGKGSGSGKGQVMTEREKRMVRWNIMFKVRNGEDFIDQLRDLEAILAMPIGNSRKDYQICDLKKAPPYRFENADIGKLNRIWWWIEEPPSVRMLSEDMHVRGKPNHYIALMSNKMEEELAEKEKKFQGLDPEQIYETKFEFVRVGPGKYDIKVLSQKRL
jgi:hypothetical protein